MNEASNPYQKYQDSRPFGSAIPNYSGPSVEEIVELLRGFNEHAHPWQLKDSDPDWHRAVWLNSFFQQDAFTTRKQLEIAMEALREVNASTSSSRLRRVTAEAFKSIKNVGEA